MKIGIIGYGKMGKVIEQIAIERGHEIAYKLNEGEIKPEVLRQADVAIEFSVPEAAPANIEMCIQNRVPIVVGTTGWYDEYDRLSKLARENNGSLFTATNFSVGVNLFFAVNRYLAKLMNGQDQYDVEMEEIHHIHKLDSPSGTAITLAEGLIDELDRKNKWVCQEGDTPIETGSLDLKINAKRENEVPGTHSIVYDSEIDKITITHEAKGRKGFAMGSVLAAEWVADKQGVFGMKDLLGNL